MKRHFPSYSRTILLGMLMLLFGVSCQAKLGYEKSVDFGAGYRDKKMSDDEFSVTVKGYPSTSPQRVARLALLRAAKLTTEGGREFFVVLENIQTSQETSLMTSVFIPIPGGSSLLVPVSVGTANEPIAFLLVKTLPSSSDGSDALDAEQVIAEVTAQLESEGD